MGLGNKVTKFDFDANDLAADDSSDGESIDEVNAFGSVLCSICIESVTKEGDRAWAKLHCGHEFHLGRHIVIGYDALLDSIII